MDPLVCQNFFKNSEPTYAISLTHPYELFFVDFHTQGLLFVFKLEKIVVFLDFIVSEARYEKEDFSRLMQIYYGTPL